MEGIPYGIGTRLSATRRPKLAGIKATQRYSTYTNEVIQVNGLVTVSLNFDTATYNVNESLPLEVFWEVAEAGPFASEGLCAEVVLLLLDRRGLVIPELCSVKHMEHV